MELKYSQFKHVFEKKDKVCIYHSLTMDSVYIDKQEFLEFEKNFNENRLDNKELISKLIDSHLLIDKNYDENKMLNNIRKTIFDGVNL